MVDLVRGQPSFIVRRSHVYISSAVSRHIGTASIQERLAYLGEGTAGCSRPHNLCRAVHGSGQAYQADPRPGIQEG